MAKCHPFNFDGGEELSHMGATWFVSFAYYTLLTQTSIFIKILTLMKGDKVIQLLKYISNLLLLINFWKRNVPIYRIVIAYQ